MTLHTLVLGVGNPTRGDDGVGPGIARRLEALGLGGVEVRTVQQLQVEWVETFARFDRLLVIDAAVVGEAVALRPVAPDATAPTGASHHLTAPLLLALAARLHGRVPEAWLCTVRGEEFGFGDNLSPQARDRADEAFGRIVSWLGAVPRAGSGAGRKGGER